MANVANSGGTGTSSAPHLTVEEWRVKLDTWVARLDAHLPADYVPIDIDVSLDSGGFRGYYMAPAMHFLQKSRRYRVVRVAGASAGAAGACGLVCNIDVPKYISMFHSRYQPQVLQQGRPILDVFHDIVTDLFPANAHELCHGRVFISVHEIMPLSWSRLSWRGGGLEHQCITDFPTFDDLLQVMKCSMTVSKITTSQNAHLYNGRSYLDGIKPLLPCDPTAIGRLHMFIDLHRLPYPGTWMMSPRDPNIDNLTERGMIDFEQFLAVEDTHGSGTSHNRETNQSPIYWIHPERTAFMSPTTTSSTGCTPVTVGAGAGAAAATASAGPGLDGEFLPSATSTAPSSSSSASSSSRFAMAPPGASHEMQRGQQRLLRTVHMIGSTWDRMLAARDRIFRESHVLQELLSPSRPTVSIAMAAAVAGAPPPIATQIAHI